MERFIRLAQHGLRERGHSIAGEEGKLGAATVEALQEETKPRKIKGLPDDWEPERRAVAYVQILCRRAGIDVGEVDGKRGPKTDSAATALEQTFRAIVRFVQREVEPGLAGEDGELGPRTREALEAAARAEGLPQSWPPERQLVGYVQSLCRESGFKEVGEVDGILGPRTRSAFDSLAKLYDRRLKIGLALSGGGFRSAIFHLGVIRRLEELGIMPWVSVISSVSGGSIIAAYYVIEMERRLRARRREAADDLRKVRLKLFEEIARDFFQATDHNLRIRALVFSPFYHPIATLKLLNRSYSRADLMQAEYDRWFFGRNTLDQLPSVTDLGESQRSYLSGPKLVVNTTSLLTGRRVAFSRVPMSSIQVLSKVNTNVLPLSRIVGASAGVPGLFPPTPVSGDLLVDGGVSDNQGLEGLFDEECDVMLISDASGQMEQLHELKAKAVSVLGRTNAIFQSGIRSQLIQRLLDWDRGSRLREFAFVHLYLNLKGRPGVEHRVPSEYIAGLGRIRTDLDQFSYVERESLMFHGYTLIDSQISRYCPRLMKQVAGSEAPAPPEKLRVPPLFAASKPRPESAQEEPDANRVGQDLAKRTAVKRTLAAGAQSLLILRAVARYGWKAGAVVALGWLLPVALFLYFGLGPLETLLFEGLAPVFAWFGGLLPPALREMLGALSPYASWPITFRGALAAVVFLLSAYLLVFVTFSIMRWLTRKWELMTYRRLTDGADPDAPWPEPG